MDEASILILGAGGQLGKALRDKYPGAKIADKDELDITDEESIKNYNWDGITTILNAAAYTNVDGAETPEGQAAAWAVNDKAVGNLAEIAKAKDLVLVHISTDYVFDGRQSPHKEDEPFSPLGIYGKSKAAGDVKVAQVPKHHIVRTSWLIGNGKNFVRTMLELGQKDISPTVVADQIGRPTFATELAKAIDFIITNKAPYGIYNMTNEGDSVSWADFARTIFKESGLDLKVTDTTTKEYFASKSGTAPRPLNSVLDLSKIEATGFKPKDWREDLKDYIKKELKK
jgi:dTDP-4-dehydrorhamnose 3,5-epimerase